MKRLCVCVVIVAAFILAAAGVSRAADEAVPAAEDPAYKNVTTCSGAEKQEEPATPGRSLTEMLRDYNPGDTPDEQDGQNKLFDVETDRTINYDEKKIFKHKSGTGYQKQKEDFADPKKIMSK